MIEGEVSEFATARHRALRIRRGIWIVSAREPTRHSASDALRKIDLLHQREDRRVASTYPMADCEFAVLRDQHLIAGSDKIKMALRSGEL